MPTVVRPEDDDGVLLKFVAFQGGKDSSNLTIDKAGTGKIGACQIAPFVDLLQKLESHLGQVPVQVPGETGCVLAVIAANLWQHGIVIRIKVPPFLCGVAGHVGKKEAD